MALKWDITKCADIAHLFVGVTAEEASLTHQADAVGSRSYIDFDKAADSPTSDWFRVSNAEGEVKKALEEKGYAFATRKPYVEQVLFALMATMPTPGWGLTAKNIDKAVRRLLIWQHATGPLNQKFDLHVRTEDRHWSRCPMNEDDIRALLGLYVNIAPVTDREFLKRLEMAMWDKVQYLTIPKERIPAKTA